MSPNGASRHAPLTRALRSVTRVDPVAVYVHPTRVLYAEAIRDLIGILRVLHAAELEMPNADQAKLDKLAMVARELKDALPIVVALQPKEGPYQRVVGRLDWALRQLEPSDLLDVAGRRVRGEWKRSG
jgi:hypothetical protein